MSQNKGGLCSDRAEGVSHHSCSRWSRSDDHLLSYGEYHRVFPPQNGEIVTDYIQQAGCEFQRPPPPSQEAPPSRGWHVASIHCQSALYNKPSSERNTYFSILRRKHSMVFSIRQQMVIGPTPPGTGVITDAFGSIAA